MLGRGEQDDATGLADREGRLGVPREEQPLDADDRRPVQLDQFAHGGVDAVQPVGQGVRGRW